MTNKTGRGVLLFLDDYRLPKDAGDYMNDSRYLTECWVLVRTYKEFVRFIEKEGLPTLISFDHDLANEHYGFNGDYNELKEKTGYHCAKWLVDYCFQRNLPLPEYLVHSMNPVGRENITLYLNNYRRYYEKNIGDRTSTPSS